MHHRINPAVQRREISRPRFGIPEDLILSACRSAHQTRDMMPLRAQERNQRTPNQSRGAAYQNPQRHRIRARVIGRET